MDGWTRGLPTPNVRETSYPPNPRHRSKRKSLSASVNAPSSPATSTRERSTAEKQIDAAIEAVRDCRSPRAAIIAMNTADVLRWLGRLQRSLDIQTFAAE